MSCLCQKLPVTSYLKGKSKYLQCIVNIYLWYNLISKLSSLRLSFWSNFFLLSYLLIQLQPHWLLTFSQILLVLSHFKTLHLLVLFPLLGALLPRIHGLLPRYNLVFVQESSSSMTILLNCNSHYHPLPLGFLIPFIFFSL